MTTRLGDGVPLSRRLARFNRTVANPVMRLVAGRLPPFAIVRHRGRRTGRFYATPVLAFDTDEGLILAVLYGMSSDWVKNVLPAGHVEVRRRRESHQYEHPVLIGNEGIQLLPTLFRGPFRLLDVHHFIRLTRAPDDFPA